MQAEETETATEMRDAAETGGTGGAGETAAAAKARERRVCEYIKMGSARCSGTAKLGRPYCFKHDQFARSRGAVNVALLEDEASILLAVSHIVRALGDNEIPVANANAMLRGCHVATRVLEYRLRKEMFLAQERREAAAEGAAAGSSAQGEADAGRAEMGRAGTAAAETAPVEVAALEVLAEMTPRERTAAEIAAAPLEEAPMGGEEGVARVNCMDGAVYEPAEGEDANHLPQREWSAEDCYTKAPKPRFYGLQETWEKGLVRPRVALLDSKMGKLQDMPKWRYPAPEPGPVAAKPAVGEEFERGMAAAEARLRQMDAERNEAAESGELAVARACGEG